VFVTSLIMGITSLKAKSGDCFTDKNSLFNCYFILEIQLCVKELDTASIDVLER